MAHAQVTYISTAVSPFSDEEIKALMRVSRRNNRARDLTGLLLTQDNRFLQVLEGPEPAVANLMDTLHQDPRHRDIEILYRHTVAERQFGRWAMGCHILGNEASELDERVRGILRVARPEGEQAIALLRSFREVERRSMDSLG